MKHTIHNLKILPEYFKAVKSGKKTFEVRENDRGFKTGDYLILQEITPLSGVLTGRNIKVKVIYILAGGSYGIAENYVIMSIKKEN